MSESSKSWENELHKLGLGSKKASDYDFTLSQDMREDAHNSESHIIESIHAAILEQRLPPGTKLSEAILSEIFAVGRSRIRRVLLVLASREIIQLHSNRGAFVAEPSADEARNIFEARRTIEPTIIRNAITYATEEDIAALERLCSHHDHGLNNRGHAIRQSGDFHIELAKIGRNHVLEGIISQLVARTSLIIALFGTPVGLQCSDIEHHALLHALRQKQSDHAAQLMLSHLQHIESELNLTKPTERKAGLRAIFGVQK